MNPQPPRPPPPPRKRAAAEPVGSGSNKHIKNLGGKFNEAMRPAPSPPVEGMAKMKIDKPSMAVGGTVSEGILLRRPYYHCMAGMTSFEHGMGSYRGIRYNPTNQNFAQATFVQGGYFPEADHRLI